MKRSTLQWAAILKACGVKSAQITAWAGIFAEVITDTSFSLGDKEVDVFLGQILHESNMLACMEESLYYRADRIRVMGMASPIGSRWRALVSRADALAGNPQAMANAVYGGRLGNVAANDGWNYRGSGPIQVTGLANFAALATITGLPLVKNPDLLRTATREALLVCIAWWEGNVPDSVMASPRKVRKEVNGGDFGLAETTRIALLAKQAIATIV